eukprot:10463471-Ditylum_brightwellii.AAC.1
MAENRPRPPAEEALNKSNVAPPIDATKIVIYCGNTIRPTEKSGLGKIRARTEESSAIIPWRFWGIMLGKSPSVKTYPRKDDIAIRMLTSM